MNEDWLAVVVGLALPALSPASGRCPSSSGRDPGQRDPVTEQTTEPRTEERSSGIGYAIGGLLVVIALGAATRFLEQQVPQWATRTVFAKVAKSIESRSMQSLWG